MRWQAKSSSRTREGVGRQEDLGQGHERLPVALQTCGRQGCSLLLVTVKALAEWALKAQRPCVTHVGVLLRLSNHNSHALKATSVHL